MHARRPLLLEALIRPADRSPEGPRRGAPGGPGHRLVRPGQPEVVRDPMRRATVERGTCPSWAPGRVTPIS